jgi:hypothetical protein
MRGGSLLLDFISAKDWKVCQLVTAVADTLITPPAENNNPK